MPTSAPQLLLQASKLGVSLHTSHFSVHGRANAEKWHRRSHLDKSPHNSEDGSTCVQGQKAQKRSSSAEQVLHQVNIEASTQQGQVCHDTKSNERKEIMRGIERGCHAANPEFQTGQHCTGRQTVCISIVEQPTRSSLLSIQHAASCHALQLLL